MERVALIDGVRTPFVKAAGVFSSQSALDLATEVTKGIIARPSLSDQVIDEFVFSSVLLDPRTPNMAREIIFKAGLSASIPAHFISNNCISGLVAVSHLVGGIATKRIRTGIAGGVESMSNPALAFQPRAEKFFLALSRARTMSERLSILATFRPGFILPIPPSPKEPSTGMTMGEHCEIMAKEFAISRVSQDQWALESHQRAAKAASFFAQDIIPVGGVIQDNLVRADTSIEKLTRLKPVFDRSGQGTITAGSASSLTDGASAVYLASETHARERGMPILAFIEGIEFSAIQPDAGLLMAPAFALPTLLSKSGIRVSDVDIFEIHEAFSAQVLANLSAWEGGWKRFPEYKAIGSIDRNKINPNGGSVAIGHPFAATGGRLLLSLARELRAKNLRRGVISVCAAGGMACALMLCTD
jgi:acetyl-CoA acetyltransferase family protein